MNITLSGTKVSMDGHTLAFQKNNLVDSMVITVDTDETWQYKLDVKYPCKDSNGKELYNVIDLTRVGNTCTAILQATMLPFNGKYTMQLRGVSGDKIYHTDTFDVWVKYSIDPGKVYDPVPSEFYQIESNITSMNNHPPKPGDNGYWLVWNVTKQEYEESDIPLPEETLPEVSDSTNGWYLTNDGERVYWAEVQGGSGEGDITAIQVNGTDQPIVDKVAKLTIGKATVGLDNLDNVRQYSSVNPPPYPVTSVNGQTGDVTINTDGKVTSVNTKTGAVVLGASDVGAVATSDVTQTLGTSTTKVPSEKAVSDAIGAAGWGDMLKSTYDPDGSVATAGGIPDYVEANGGKIDTVKVNGTAQPITNKSVDIAVPTNNNQLTNGAGYITSGQVPVQSVNGKTGEITLVKGDVGLGNVDNVKQYSATNPPPYPVDSVNGKTGAVQLDIPTALPNPNALTIKIGSTTTTYDGSSVQTVDVPTDDNPLGITGATVGQIAKITAVDTDGKPTAWSPVDMTGEEKWEKISEIELRADTAEYVLADFATWRKAKVIMTRQKYISGLNKNVWCRVVGQDDMHSCGYLTAAYGYVFWEYSAEVNDLFIISSQISLNNLNAAESLKSTGTFMPLASPVESYKFKLMFTDTSVIQAGDKVTVIGVRR